MSTSPPPQRTHTPTHSALKCPEASLHPCEQVLQGRESWAASLARSPHSSSARIHLGGKDASGFTPPPPPPSLLWLYKALCPPPSASVVGLSWGKFLACEGCEGLSLVVQRQKGQRSTKGSSQPFTRKQGTFSSPGYVAVPKALQDLCLLTVFLIFAFSPHRTWDFLASRFGVFSLNFSPLLQSGL